MPSNNIGSRFAQRLRDIATETLPSFSMLFGTWDDVDRLLDHASYPAILNILSVSGGASVRNGRVYQRENLLLAFVDKVPRDASGVENINAVERMRQAMIVFVNAVNESGLFVPITDYNYTTIYEGGANIHTGVLLELVSLTDSKGSCISTILPIDGGLIETIGLTEGEDNG